MLKAAHQLQLEEIENEKEHILIKYNDIVDKLNCIDEQDRDNEDMIFKQDNTLKNSKTKLIILN